jgi:4-hydroxy-3-polyprenylbenzoate decarboxylase
VAASTRAGGVIGRFTIVVDDDIDVFNTDEVLWAMATRCDPVEDIEILKGSWTTGIDPVLSPEKRQAGDYTSSRIVVDASIPYLGKNKFPPVCVASAEWK